MRIDRDRLVQRPGRGDGRASGGAGRVDAPAQCIGIRAGGVAMGVNLLARIDRRTLVVHEKLLVDGVSGQGDPVPCIAGVDAGSWPPQCAGHSFKATRV
ncbi:hypothetical protein GALL_295360 [mine drainage metagenome]|uniref:Uncharacterized protein n=1 Tax=mine drainage metagenome TaxID=410659 RepID=A0A1J5RK99_9ZZZZ